MRSTRAQRVLVILLGLFVAVLLGAAPAVADVDCADLGNRTAAQAYFEGRTADVDHLDSDADGQACEKRDPAYPGSWILIGIGVLILAASVSHVLLETRKARRHAAQRRPLHSGGPFTSPRSEQRAGAGVAPPGHRQRLLSTAATGSLADLERALRLLPDGKRMPLVEQRARVQGSTPQDVLDALVKQAGDLRVQGWALAGYDPPSSVRLRFCSCVGGVRNFKLHTDADGVRSWTCATCGDPQLTGRDHPPVHRGTA